MDLFFSDNLLSWYALNKRDLPWRKTKDPYKIWLSEIILQQTQIKQGTPYYNAFIERFPNVKDLAEASEEEVLKLWQGLGYYSRAINLHQTANIIHRDCEGIFPKTYPELLKLKGVGEYTAAAVSSICFAEAVPVIDGNVIRILSRFYGVDAPVDALEGKKIIKQLARSCMPPNDISDYNQSIMEFGALMCKPRNPNCNQCPIKIKCKAFINNEIYKFPIKKNRKKTKDYYFNYVVIIDRKERLVMFKRNAKGIWKNLYEFYLIESDKLMSEKGLLNHLKVMPFYVDDTPKLDLYNEKVIVHKLTHKHLYVRFWRLKTDKTIKEAFTKKEILRLAVPQLIAKFISKYL